METINAFDHYSVQIYGGTTGRLALLLCYKADAVVGRIEFYPDGADLPLDYLWHPTPSAVYVVLHMPIGRFEAVMSTVRNEKPLHLYINVDSGSGEFTQGTGYLATTEQEPVGEEERAPRSPLMDHLVFWGTAAAEYLVPQNDWAADFRSNISIIYLDDAETAFFGDTDFTVATWVKPTDVSAYNIQCPYSQWNWNGIERKFYFMNDDTENNVSFAVFKQGVGSGIIKTQNNLGKMQNNRWYRLVGMYNKGVETSFYVNNQFVGSLPWTHGIEPGDGKWPQQPWIGDISRGGRNYDINQYWRGHIGPTCYYTRLWTPQEVVWDYNSGKGRRYSELGQPSTDGEDLLNGLVAFWQLTEEDTGRGSYVVRQDAHTGQHHLTRIIGSNPVSVAGILPKTEPIGDDERVQGLTDRSARGNSIVQTNSTLQPYWDAKSAVVSIEPGSVFIQPNFSGLDGRRLSLYLVSIVKDSTESEPWFHLSDSGRENTGLKLYRDNDTFKLKAWIGGSARTLSYRLSYPAERLFEVHYNGNVLSLWENNTQKASLVVVGSFDHPLNQLKLGPEQGLKELLIYSEVQR
ncbi:MAG: hypothetical protein O7E52_25300 [Candidatus Poribacteria bacterium]|nr:hypothetical protein [Candidatus Poribacteria bacterium]